MAFRLGEYVVAGKLINTRRNSTHGWMAIRGWTRPLHLEFTGDPGPDLRGRRLYFETSSRVYGGVEHRDGSELRIEPRQFGATGTMTAHTLVRVFEGSVENFLNRSRLGEPPPMEWKRRLYLEWFGNSGRVVVELVDPLMRFIETRDGDEVEVPLAPPEDPPFDPNFPPENGPGPEITVVGAAEDEAFPIAKDSDGPAEDSFHLFPPSLEASVAESLGTDPLGGKRPECENELESEMILMDDLMERGGGMELGEVLGKVSDWRSLSEERAGDMVKLLVGRLTMYRVSFDICEHVTMRDAYRILTVDLAGQCRIHPELRGTGWVTHLSTSDFCPKCQSEFEEDDFWKVQ